MEWIHCQWLASCGVAFEDLDQFVEINDLNQLNPTKTLVVEPGNIQDHQDKAQLMELLEIMVSKDQVIFLCNEEEFKEFAQLPARNMVVHSSDKLLVRWKKREKEMVVPTLPCEPKNFIGAGDAFLAGIISALMQSHHNLDQIASMAISVAQDHICGILS